MNSTRSSSAGLVLLAAAAAALLPACGGGGGGDINQAGDTFVQGTDVPRSATTSAAGAFAFVQSLASTRSDTADPIVVGDATLGTSESDDPQALQP